MDALNRESGISKHTRSLLDSPVMLGGVGKNSQRGTHKVSVPISLSEKAPGVKNTKFEATVIEDSGIPALLGMKSLKAKNAVLDIQNNVLYLCSQPGKITITYEKDVQRIPLIQAPGGYLMLPCSLNLADPSQGQSIFATHSQQPESVTSSCHHEHCSASNNADGAIIRGATTDGSTSPVKLNAATE